MTLPEPWPPMLVCAYGLILLLSVLFVKNDIRMKLNGLCVFAALLPMLQGWSTAALKLTMIVMACVFPIVCYSTFSYLKYLIRIGHFDAVGKAKRSG